MSFDAVKIGLVSVSDRASAGVYQDQGIPSLKAWLQNALLNPIEFVEGLIPDEQAEIENALKKLADEHKCNLI